MALIDTGLGWSADEDFLKQYAGLLGNITVTGGSAYPNQPIPYTEATKAAVKAGGLLAVESSTGSEYYSTQNADVGIFICHVGDILYALSTTRGAHLNRFWNTGSGTTGTLYDRQCSDTISGVTGVYRWIGPSMGGTSPVWNVPGFSSIQEAAQALRNTQPYYKLADGYSVGMFLKYMLDPGPHAVTGLCLISSDPSYTQISTDGTTPYSPDRLHYFVYQGMTFSMRFIIPVENGTVSGNVVPYRDITSAGNMTIIQDLFESAARLASITVTGSSDPYQEDPNEPGGGPTEPDDTDDIPFAIPPYITASSSGFVKIFNPTLGEINSLASFMWSTGFDLDTVKRVYANPIDYIIGASIVPVIPSVKTASYPISFPGLAGSISSGVTMDEVYQYVTLSCGSLNIPHKWNSYLDYSPYHRFQIWLPYIGFRDLDADDIMGKTIELQYVIDLLSGSCNAELLCGGSVLYSWQGQCAAQIPINSNDWSSMLTGAISLAASAVKLGVSVATGGATASSVVTDIASAGASAFNLKPSISRGGTVAGAAGFMAQQRPYIIRTRPELALPDAQAHFSGYPSFTTVNLGAISGYAEVYSVHLHNIPATEAELREIETLLTEGVLY